jgi:hypothetical protein
MIGRKAAIGMALLCALVFCAFSASSASAIAGTTSFTCVKVEVGAQFKDAHCKESGTGAGFAHKEIAENTTTKTHITNEKTNATTTEHTVLALKAEKQPLVGETEITCTKVLGHGDLTNTKNAVTKEHTITGSKITLHYRECKFVKPGFCKVKGGTILAEKIRATTAGQGDSIKFEPEEGTTFVTIEAEGFGCPAKLPVEGTVTAKTNGATIEFDHTEITGAKSLTVNKQPAGLSGKATVRSAETTKEKPATDVYEETGTPISTTTVTT